MIVLLYTQAMALWIIPRRFFLFLSMQSNGALNDKFEAPFSLQSKYTGKNQGGVKQWKRYLRSMEAVFLMIR